MLWRKKRTIADLNKHDVEYREGVFLDMSGMSSELVVGTPEGVFRTRDLRALSDHGAKWNGKFLLEFDTSFEKYIDPTAQNPDGILIEPGVIAHDVLPPDVEVATGTRRMRLAPSDFLLHGYTAGCPGCIALRRKALQSRNHSEPCRLRMQECLGATADGRARKEREATRKEDELTAALKAEDSRIQMDKDLGEKAAQEKIMKEKSESAPPQGESSAEPAQEDAGTTEHFMMTPERTASQAATPSSHISSENFATDDVPMDVLNRELFAPDDRQSPGSSRGAKRAKSSSAQAEFDDRVAAPIRTRPESDQGSPSIGPAHDAKRPKVGEDADMGDLKVLSAIFRGVDITEVYSPQRVVEVCHRYGLIKGDSFDLRTGFDLSDPDVQRRVTRRIVETNAKLVILSPPCTKFSTLQALNVHVHGPEWAAAFEIEKTKAIEHIAFSMKIAKLQILI